MDLCNNVVPGILLVVAMELAHVSFIVSVYWANTAKLNLSIMDI